MVLSETVGKGRIEFGALSVGEGFFFPNFREGQSKDVDL